MNLTDLITFVQNEHKESHLSQIAFPLVNLKIRFTRLNSVPLLYDF